jgi:hypothetical protein
VEVGGVNVYKASYRNLGSWSAGDECVGGKCSLVTGWGRIGREGEGWVNRVGKKGLNELLGRRAMDFSTREGGRVKGVRVGMRR